MRALILYKLPSRDGVVCEDCLKRDFASHAGLAVSLHPSQFPATYRLMKCTSCQSTCTCEAAVCGGQLCRTLRLGFSRPGEIWPYGLAARPTVTPDQVVTIGDREGGAIPARPESRWR